MLHAVPADARPAPVRFSDLPAQRALTSAQVVDLVLAAVAACHEAIPGVEGLPLPGADRIVLHPDGRVTVDVPALPGDDRQRMLAVATLLRDLLSLEAPAGTGRVAVPGPLLMLVARAFGTIDLPAPSFEALCQALARFGSVAPALPAPDVDPPASGATVRHMPAAAATAPTSAHSPAARCENPFAGCEERKERHRGSEVPRIHSRFLGASVPLGANLSVPPGRGEFHHGLPGERPQQDGHLAALPPEIRLHDRELFEAHASHSGVRGVPIVVAVAIWAVAILLGAVLMRGGLDLLEGSGRSVHAREIADDRPTPTEGRAPTMPTRTTGAAPPTGTPAPRVDAGSRAVPNRGSGVNGAARPNPRASGREPRRRTAPRARKHT